MVTYLASIAVTVPRSSLSPLKQTRVPTFSCLDCSGVIYLDLPARTSLFSCVTMIVSGASQSHKASLIAIIAKQLRDKISRSPRLRCLSATVFAINHRCPVESVKNKLANHLVAAAATLFAAAYLPPCHCPETPSTTLIRPDPFSFAAVVCGIWTSS